MPEVAVSVRPPLPIRRIVHKPALTPGHPLPLRFRVEGPTADELRQAVTVVVDNALHLAHVHVPQLRNRQGPLRNHVEPRGGLAISLGFGCRNPSEPSGTIGGTHRNRTRETGTKPGTKEKTIYILTEASHPVHYI